MTDSKLYIQISSLPEVLKKEVLDFAKFLYDQKKNTQDIKSRKFGYSKGFFKVSKNFNEPVEDFKEYM